MSDADHDAPNDAEPKSHIPNDAEPKPNAPNETGPKPHAPNDAEPKPCAPLIRRLTLTVVALLIAAVIWLPCVHLFFRRDVDDYFAAEGIGPQARAARHLALWTDPALKADELRKMRASNAEWDFMGRTFLVLALANMECREPHPEGTYLRVIDEIIDDTLAVEKEKGMYHFLMAYALSSAYVERPPRSLFIDGEIALMLGVRCVLERKPAYERLLDERVALMVERMGRSPVPMAESYPNECWMFDNVLALAAIRISDLLNGTDHSDFIGRWLDTAKAKLTDPVTGLLVSNCTVHGTPGDGPEGSTLWMTAYALKLFDEEFARDQYGRAKKELAGHVLGYGYAREWPDSWEGPWDIDSGPIVPVLNISAGSSGLAFVGASGFGDRAFLTELLTTLEFAAFPSEKGGRLKYCASNQVGDAVLLYATVLGPLWDRIKAMEKR